MHHSIPTLFDRNDYIEADVEPTNGTERGLDAGGRRRRLRCRGKVKRDREDGTSAGDHHPLKGKSFWRCPSREIVHITHRSRVDLKEKKKEKKEKENEYNSGLPSSGQKEQCLEPISFFEEEEERDCSLPHNIYVASTTSSSTPSSTIETRRHQVQQLHPSVLRQDPRFIFPGSVWIEKRVMSAQDIDYHKLKLTAQPRTQGRFGG